MNYYRKEKKSYPEISFLRILLSTHLAGEGFLSGVGHKMTLHGCNTDKLLSAHPANRKDLRRALPVS